jgi:hypothetical protein
MTHTDHGASPAKRKGFLARWFEAMAEARMRHAEHEIHQHIPDERENEARRTGDSGGKGH